MTGSNFTCGRGVARTGERMIPAAVFFLTAAEALAADPGFAAPTPLEIDRAQAETRAANEPVSYLIRARGGEILLLQLEQQGLDFRLVVTPPDGDSTTYNSPLGRDERELVLLEPPAPGEWVITVESDELTHASGSYVLRATELRVESDEDRSVLEAYRLMSLAAAAYDPRDRQAALRALSLYRDAAQAWAALRRARELAQAEYSVGVLAYEAAYDWDQSAIEAGQAAGLYASLGLEALRAGAIALEGMALIEKANELPPDQAARIFERALGRFRAAAEIRRELGDEYALAELHNNVGMTYFYMGRWDDARREWDTAGNEFGQLGEWRAELNARQNQAVIDGLQGYNARAIEILEAIVDTIPESADPQFLVNVLDNLAANHRRYGNYEDALVTYSRARVIHAQIDDEIGEAYSLIGIGNTYYSIGELDLAKKHLQLALPMVEKARDGRSREALLARLGDIEYEFSDYPAAAALHRQAVDLAASDPDRAHRLLSLARDYAAMERYDEALAASEEAAARARSSRSLVIEADALTQIARVEVARGAPLPAQEKFERALEIYRSLGLRSGQAETLNGLATAALARGDYDLAIAHAQASVAAMESLRERVASPELRALYSASGLRLYETYIDALMSRSAEDPDAGQEFMQDALKASEGARARLTIDLLNEASVELRARADPDTVAEERRLLEELAAKAQTRDRLLRHKSLSEQDERDLAALDESMTALENRLHVARSELRRRDPAYSQIMSLEPADLDQIQAMLDPDTVLLQYAVGDRKSFAWAVSRTTVAAVEIAARSVLEQASLRVLEQLRTIDYGPGSRAALRDALHALAAHVIFPLAEHLAGATRVLVAPDGPLEYVPFAVLPPSPAAGGQMLVETHETITLPSMSVVRALRSRQAATPSRLIAVFADPVLDGDDPRLPEPGDAASQTAALADVSATRSAATLTRLPWTATEAQTISELVPAGERHVAVGFEANRQQVMSLDLSAYRFLHFATHGLVDSRYPSLSSLALSRFDADGRPVDGFLRLYDIFDLRLAADLVTLSACDTALGRQIRGEGLIGLAQGFMYAGARTLLVSLWQVPDRATAELMAAFYTAMLNPAGATTPLAALRAAQLELAAQPRWRHPYFWAAFVLIGDWQ